MVTMHHSLSRMTGSSPDVEFPVMKPDELLCGRHYHKYTGLEIFIAVFNDKLLLDKGLQYLLLIF